MGVEDLFARPEHLDRPTREHGQLGDTELEAEGIRLASEGAAEAGLNDAHVWGSDAQDLGDLPLDVVGDLGR